jgi:hypothetical protein
MQAARDLEADIPEEPLRGFAFLIDGIMPTTFHVLARFGRWEQILAEPDYPEWRLMSRVVRAYARSVACSALGRTEQARQELAEFERRAALVPEDWLVMQNKAHDVLPIARAMANGELLFREGRREEAYAVLREGVAMEDRLVYDEPPGWMLPVRHALGALMMADERYAECEAIYREDLARNRENMWALTGLRLALAAQGKTEEAVRPARAWRRRWPTRPCGPVRPASASLERQVGAAGPRRPPQNAKGTFRCPASSTSPTAARAPAATWTSRSHAR